MTVIRCGFPRVKRGALAANQQGSSLIEFALAAPLVVLMIVGAIEFGMIMFVSTLMESALRDAARFGITGQVPDGATRLDQILAIVEQRTIGLVDMSDAKIEVRVYPTFGDVGRGVGADTGAAVGFPGVAVGDGVGRGVGPEVGLGVGNGSGAVTVIDVTVPPKSVSPVPV